MLFDRTMLLAQIDPLALTGTVAAVVAAAASIAALVLVIRQIEIMRAQTTLMRDTIDLTNETKVLAKRELEIVEKQVQIQQSQDDEFRKTPSLWAYSKGAIALSGRDPTISIPMRVFNFGTRSASRFRIVVAVPPGYRLAEYPLGAGHSRWSPVDDFASKNPTLAGYAFFRHDSTYAAYPDDYVQFARLDLQFHGDAPYEPKPIFWRVSTESQQHPRLRGQYYRLTSNSYARESQAERIHYSHEGRHRGLDEHDLATSVH